MTFDPAGWDRMASGQAGGAAWIFERAIERVAEMAGSPVGGARRLLDVGCGTGRLAARLDAAGWEVTAMDADPSMVRHVAARGAAARVLTGTAGALPFPDATFARITASSLLGLLAAPAAFLTEAHRCLVPGGALIVTATNRDSRLLKLNYALPRSWVVPRAAGPRERFTTWSIGELVALLGSAGFRVDPCHTFNFVLHAGPWVLPPRGVARRIDAFGINGAHRTMARNLIAVGWAGR